MAERGIQERQLGPITSHFEGQTRTTENMMAIPYNIPKGNSTAYYPEANGLVPVASVAYISNTPTSTFVIVTT